MLRKRLITWHLRATRIQILIAHQLLTAATISGVGPATAASRALSVFSSSSQSRRSPTVQVADRGAKAAASWRSMIRRADFVLLVEDKLNFREEILVAAGLLQEREGGESREFFGARIMFPICDSSGAVIGFSAHKYHEGDFRKIYQYP